MRIENANAFSLVEVTLSIGIVAFGLIAILGLLPSGLQSFRGSIGRTVGAQVSQAIISDLKQSDFTNLAKGLTNGVGYSNYTQEGIPTSVAADTIFTAEITVTQPPIVFPGATNFSMARVKVRIVENPNGAKSGTNAFPTGVNIPTFTSYVAKTAQ